MVIKAQSLNLTQEAHDNGIVSGRGILMDEETRFVYLVIDPEKANDEYLQKEAKESWLLYINNNKKITNNETPEKTIA